MYGQLPDYTMNELRKIFEDVYNIHHVGFPLCIFILFVLCIIVYYQWLNNYINKHIHRLLML